MMCEASEDEVEVSQHPPVRNDSNTNEADEPVSKDRSVSHNKIEPTRSEDSSTVANNGDLPNKENISEDKHSNVDDSVSNIVPSNETSVSDNDDDESTEKICEHVQVENDKQLTEPPEAHNPKCNVQQNSEDDSNHELNGHTNGSCVNESNDKEIARNHVSDNCRNAIGVQSPRPSVGHIGSTQNSTGRSTGAYAIQEQEKIEIKPIPIGDPKVRSKIRFEVVTARVIETGGKKHVAYTIMMKRVGHEPHPAVIERRYSDFCFVYECILRSFHPSILGDFMFPKKVLIGNFKAEVISERTDAFHKFLNLIANCDNLLYSDYFYSFLSSEEHNEAVSHLKLARYTEAIPLLESIFYVREKLLSVGSIHVLLCSCELVACLSADVTSGMIDRHKRRQEAFAFAQVAAKSFDIVYQSSNADEVMVAESLRIPYLKLALELASELGQDKKAYARQLSELRYAGVKLENSPTLLEVIRDRYIHRASHTSKIS